ncbi:MAG: Epoxide hydrolase, partial [uncultured Nocardioides sp.]
LNRPWGERAAGRCSQHRGGHLAPQLPRLDIRRRGARPRCRGVREPRLRRRRAALLPASARARGGAPGLRTSPGPAPHPSAHCRAGGHPGRIGGRQLPRHRGQRKRCPLHRRAPPPPGPRRRPQPPAGGTGRVRGRGRRGPRTRPRGGAAGPRPGPRRRRHGGGAVV